MISDTEFRTPCIIVFQIGSDKLPEAIGTNKLPNRQFNGSSYIEWSLEAFLCRGSTQFVAASQRKARSSPSPTLRVSPSLEAYIAGSADRKLSLAESASRSNRQCKFGPPHNLKEGLGTLPPFRIKLSAKR